MYIFLKSLSYYRSSALFVSHCAQLFLKPLSDQYSYFAVLINAVVFFCGTLIAERDHLVGREFTLVKTLSIESLIHLPVLVDTLNFLTLDGSLHTMDSAFISAMGTRNFFFIIIQEGEMSKVQVGYCGFEP